MKGIVLNERLNDICLFMIVPNSTLPGKNADGTVHGLRPDQFCNLFFFPIRQFFFTNSGGNRLDDRIQQHSVSGKMPGYLRDGLPFLKMTSENSVNIHFKDVVCGQIHSMANLSAAVDIAIQKFFHKNLMLLYLLYCIFYFCQYIIILKKL